MLFYYSINLIRNSSLDVQGHRAGFFLQKKSSRVPENTGFEQCYTDVKKNQRTVKNIHHQVLLMPFLQSLAPSTENL